MNSFSNDKLKDISTLLQLIVTALQCVDSTAGTVNKNSIYKILEGISSEDDARTANINGTLSEQMKALNDTLSQLKIAVDRTNSLLDYIDDSVAHIDSDKAYLRVMLPDNLIWT